MSGPIADDSGAGYWAVCFFDLMGYQRELLATDKWPTDGIWPLPPLSRVDVEATRRPFGLIVRRRETLVGGLRDYSDQLRATIKVSQDARSGLRQPPFDPLEAVTFRATGFSDSVFMEKMLDQGGTHQGIVELGNMIACAGIVMVLTLSDRSPVRAGFDVSYGGSKAGMLYSAATVRAVCLEKEAKYPRLLLGDHYLNCVERALRSDNSHDRAWANRLSTFTFVDPTDRRVGLDFLGEAFKAEYLYGIDPKVIEEIWTFATESYERFKDLTDEEGVKLRGYYERLVGYVESRLQIWGINKGRTID
jgi:hypothetical protein